MTPARVPSITVDIKPGPARIERGAGDKLWARLLLPGEDILPGPPPIQPALAQEKTHD